jgi:hypothetical protein
MIILRMVYSFTAKEKMGTDGCLFQQLLPHDVKNIYCDVADTPEKGVLFKIDRGQADLASKA